MLINKQTMLFPANFLFTLLTRVHFYAKCCLSATVHVLYCTQKLTILSIISSKPYKTLVYQLSYTVFKSIQAVGLHNFIFLLYVFQSPHFYLSYKYPLPHLRLIPQFSPSFFLSSSCSMPFLQHTRYTQNNTVKPLTFLADISVQGIQIKSFPLNYRYLQ